MDGEVALVKADRVAGQYVLFDAGQIPDSAWTLHTIFAKLPATYWGGALRYHQFLAFFACSARFGKNGDFLAAQPPKKRSFDRPARW